MGYALNALPEGTRVPWHRVVNAAGRVSLRSDGRGHEALQRLILRREGVTFLRDGSIPLDRWRWKPRARPPGSRDGIAESTKAAR